VRRSGAGERQVAGRGLLALVVDGRPACSLPSRPIRSG